MKLQHFREVVAIAEQGSIRAAARLLGVAQPALTRSLADLEHELGAPLFERRVRGVIPTPLGQAFVRRAASISQEIRRTEEEMAQLRGATTGTVTAGLSIAAHLAFLPSALAPFLKRYPDTRLHVIEGFYPTLEGGLREGRIDFYFGVDPGPPIARELSREVFRPNRRTVLCRAGHPLAASTSLSQLSSAGWTTTSITVSAEDEVSAIFERHGLPAPKLALRCQSALTVMTCIAYSDLLAMVPLQWSKFALTRGALTTIEVKEELAAPPLVIIKRADLPLTPAATHLLTLLKRAPAASGHATRSL
ncbi:LysR substrate-binding domain-containing protein [Muricoccus aerilatus]|uniref:LysR substrate-binding domain-containing protein n=1 Tax=Muricoccus aerilatus TaxID=452982 RepID=UPI0005C243EB|nr:LysR substrate-binding domain-containing protein [Roseomonas aerilata]